MATAQTDPARVSVQLYSVRDAIDRDLDGTVARLAGLGFRNVEPYGFADRVADYERALPAAGLAAPSGHASVIDSPEPERVFEAAARLGMQTVIDPFVAPERWTTADDARRIADQLSELVEQVTGYGLQLGYHNHHWEFGQRSEGRPVFAAFAERVDPRVVLEIDVFWAAVGGVDPAAVLEDLEDRVGYLHVKDGRIDGDASVAVQQQLPAGEGDVDLAGALRAAPSATRVLEFDQYAGDVFDGLAASLAWLERSDR